MKTILSLSLLWLASTASALQLYSDSIFTSEVSYCSTGRAVEVDRFDIRYYRNNQSIGFDINARSIAPNLNADLNIQLFAYGKSYINLSANLCDILGGALCPLPEYQFDGSFAYILPASVDINLPNIAYSVPDLDAYAQVIVTNQVTGAEALCLGATLSNGKTVYDSRVQWAIGGLTIAAFVGALIHSFWPLSPYKSGPEWRFATVLSYFQHVAICGFLSLDYPVVYKRFTLNFAWSQGLIYMQPINAAINRMRSLTGGIDRTGQTFTVIAQNSVQFSRDNLGNATDAQNAARQFSRASAYTTPTVQQAPTYNLISGIETSAESLNITYPNAFMTVFIVFLLLLAVMTAIVLLTFLGVALYSLIARRRSRSAGATEASISPTWENFRYFTWTNYMRIFLVGYTPLMIFIFWQFLHRRDSGWLAVFIAALTLVILHLAIFGIYWHLSKLANRAHNEHDHTVPWSLRWSTVSAQFKRSGYGYILLLAGASFIEAAFIAFAQGHGLVQLIPLIVIEVAVFLAFCIWRPFANRGSNALMIIISLFKVVSYGLLIAFYANLQYNGIIRAVLGFVILAVQGIMTLILFCVVVYNLFAGILWGRKARKEALAENHERAAKMMSEKDAPAGPFLRPSIVDRRSTYAPAPTSATSVSGLESGTYRPESGYAAHGQSSPVMGENDTLLPPGAAFANHHPQYNGSPDTLGNENSEQFAQQQPGRQSYVSRPESGYSDDNRTVVGSTAGENSEKAQGAGMSRFNPKFWKKGDV